MVTAGLVVVVGFVVGFVVGLGGIDVGGTVSGAVVVGAIVVTVVEVSNGAVLPGPVTLGRVITASLLPGFTLAPDEHATSTIAARPTPARHSIFGL